MIRWTKEGKVVRNAPWASWDDLADALDVAVAALRWYADPVAYSIPVQNMKHHVFPDKGKTASDALVKIGADHAD